MDLVITVPLELQNLPADLIIANQYKKDIEVAISGPKRLIQEMRQQNISRPVNLGKENPPACALSRTASCVSFQALALPPQDWVPSQPL